MTTQRELEAMAKGKICVTCGEEPQVAWLPLLPLPKGSLEPGGVHPYEFRLRCACKGGPVLSKPNSIVHERMGQLVEQQGQTALATKEGALRLAQEVKHYLAPKATTEEVAVFIKFCQGLGLNPFIKEVYLVKYDERSPAAIVVGVQAYLKWAARNPAWGGFESGVVVMKDGKASESQGSLVLPGETLVGGWCVVHRTGSVNLKRVVALSEYNKGVALWKTMPATMIEKVAIGQAVRRAFPEDFLAFQGLAERIAVTVDEEVGEEGEGSVGLAVSRAIKQAIATQEELGFGQDGDRIADPETLPPDAPQRPQEPRNDGFPPAAAPRATLPNFPIRGEQEAPVHYFIRAAQERYGFKTQTEALAVIGGPWGGWVGQCGGNAEDALQRGLAKLVEQRP